MKMETAQTCIELSIQGYEFPDFDGSDLDANWLRVAGRVRSGDLEWSFDDPCLTTGEADELRAWLREVEAARSPQSLWFIEPNLTFELISVDEASATIAVEFSLEAAPPGTDGREVRLTLALPIGELGRAAEEWERDISLFPPR